MMFRLFAALLLMLTLFVGEAIAAAKRSWREAGGSSLSSRRSICPDAKVACRLHLLRLDRIRMASLQMSKEVLVS